LPSETELAEQLGISRPVVREALRSLQSRGFLEIRRGTKGGPYVSDLDQLPLTDDFANLIRLRRITVDQIAQARLYLEPEIIRLAALHATAQDLQEMENLLLEYAATSDNNRHVSLNALFHKLLGKACGNPLYSILMESIMDFTEGFVRTIKPVTKTIHNDSEHRQILDALENHDAELAAEIGKKHITDILDKMRKLEKTYLKMTAADTAGTGRKD
jgi:DNA-binding FadR family transcriptional regulator